MPAGESAPSMAGEVRAPRPGQCRWRPEGRRYPERTLKDRLRYTNPDIALAVEFVAPATAMENANAAGYQCPEVAFEFGIATSRSGFRIFCLPSLSRSEDTSCIVPGTVMTWRLFAISTTPIAMGPSERIATMGLHNDIARRIGLQVSSLEAAEHRNCTTASSNTTITYGNGLEKK
uniref:Uncharacterized protein n=1 Tax=Leersia perrieri TaxID=77586 RepID=A0A0D9X2A5_9ORYZ